MKNSITLLILIFTCLLFQTLDFFPWWGFLVPVFFLGILLPLERWKISSFLIGFIAGFIVWTGSTFYFEICYEGKILERISKIILVSDTASITTSVVVYSLVGLIGGAVTGLAFYSGFLLRKGKETLYLETSSHADLNA